MCSKTVCSNEPFPLPAAPPRLNVNMYCTVLYMYCTSVRYILSRSASGNHAVPVLVPVTPINVRTCSCSCSLRSHPGPGPARALPGRVLVRGALERRQPERLGVGDPSPGGEQPGALRLDPALALHHRLRAFQVHLAHPLAHQVHPDSPGGTLRLTMFSLLLRVFDADFLPTQTHAPYLYCALLVLLSVHVRVI